MHNLSYENEFSFTWKLKTHSHIMKGYAPALALKKRHKTTQKGPIQYPLLSLNGRGGNKHNLPA